MPSRYYFLASIPMLRFQDHAPITWEKFLSEAKGNISEADYRLLCALDGGSDCGNAFLKSWNSMNASLDTAINDRRKALLGRDEKPSAHRAAAIPEAKFRMGKVEEH